MRFFFFGGKVALKCPYCGKSDFNTTDMNLWHECNNCKSQVRIEKSQFGNFNLVIIPFDGD